jgi:hypothetical protein
MPHASQAFFSWVRRMKLSRLQKIGIAIFLASLLPATQLANWRSNVQLAGLNEQFEKEQMLHLSTDKLLANCQKNSDLNADAYDATHQICEQGARNHARTASAMALLTEEKNSLGAAWRRNFMLTVLLFNLLAFLLYRASIYLA